MNSRGIALALISALLGYILGFYVFGQLVIHWLGLVR